MSCDGAHKVVEWRGTSAQARAVHGHAVTPTKRRLDAGLLILTLGVVTATLVYGGGEGVATVLERVQGSRSQDDSELQRLRCVQEAVVRLTRPREQVQLVTDAGNGYLRQRVTELIYPRLDLVTASDAPWLFVLTRPASPGDARCSDLAIRVDRQP